MIAAYLYLILGLGLMIVLGSMLKPVVTKWLGRTMKEAGEARGWTVLMMAGFYLLFTGYLVMTAIPLPFDSISELMLVVIARLGPLMLAIGGLSFLVFGFRYRRLKRAIPGISE